MNKACITLDIDADLLRTVRMLAARTGRSESETIESLLRKTLGFDLLDAIWARNDMPEGEALTLAIEAQHAVRRQA